MLHVSIHSRVSCNCVNIEQFVPISYTHLFSDILHWSFTCVVDMSGSTRSMIDELMI